MHVQCVNTRFIDLIRVELLLRFWYGIPEAEHAGFLLDVLRL